MSDCFTTPWTIARQAPLTMGFPCKNTGVGCHFLLQEITVIEKGKKKSQFLSQSKAF